MLLLGLTQTDRKSSAWGQKTPYYNRPTQDGLRGHFVLRAIGKRFGKDRTAGCEKVVGIRFALDSSLEGWREMDSNFRFRASGDTLHRPRGEAASHRSRLPLRRDPPSGRDLDDGTVSQLLEELAGEMNRPSDRKRRISGYGDRTWRRN